MDEPEAALSVTGQLSMLRRIHDAQRERGQFIIVASLGSPTREAQPVTLTKRFLDAPERYFRHLFQDE
jgi:hypothetical protein